MLVFDKYLWIKEHAKFFDTLDDIKFFMLCYEGWVSSAHDKPKEELEKQGLIIDIKYCKEVK